MTPTKWRKEGFKVLFREGEVFLVNLECDIMHSTPIRYGTWMYFDDITSPPWETSKLSNLPTEIFKDIMTTIVACYCDSLVDSTCDFCTGIRNAQDALRATRILCREKRADAVVIEYEDGLGNQWATQFESDADADTWCAARELAKGDEHDRKNT